MAAALYSPWGVDPRFDQGLPLPGSMPLSEDVVLYPGTLPQVYVPTGEVFIADPGVALIAQKFGLAIRFFYKSGEASNDEYGLVRSSSVHGRVLFSTSATNVTIVRG